MFARSVRRMSGCGIGERSMATLASRRYGEFEDGYVLVMHGLLASSRNVDSMARGIARETGLGVLSIDLPGHGDSPHLPPPHTLDAALNHIEETVSTESGALRGIVGHSLGGKLALHGIERLTKGLEHEVRVVALDTMPDTWNQEDEEGDDVDSVAGVLKFVSEFADKLPGDRSWLLDEMKRRGHSQAIREWLSTMVERRKKGGGEEWGWKFDAKAAVAILADHGTHATFPILQSLPQHVAVDYVVGLHGKRWSREIASSPPSPSPQTTFSALASLSPIEPTHWTKHTGLPSSQTDPSSAIASTGTLAIHTIDAGHWVHIQAPKVVLNVVKFALQN